MPYYRAIDKDFFAGKSLRVVTPYNEPALLSMRYYPLVNSSVEAYQGCIKETDSVARD